VQAELNAIERALALAARTGCALHVVHVSSGAGVALVAAARARGVDVTCETCPHYLVLDEDDADRLGALAKCAPPIRAGAEVEALWERLAAGDVDLVATDHSSAPASMKRGDDAFAVWGGISGAQTLLALMLDAGWRRRLPLTQLVGLLCAAPAQRFGLAPAKGALAVGADADLVVVDPGAEGTLAREQLLDRHRASPYVGRRLRGRVVRTIVRGHTVARDGALVGSPVGRIVTVAR
jgi:allantoinase